MLNRYLILVLALCIINLSFGTSSFAQVQDDKEARLERKAQIYVNKLGVGEQSKVKVEFKDGRKSLKGHISEINDDSFVITDKKKNSTTVQFSSVNKVSRDRLPTLALVGIVVGALIGGVLICLAAGGCVE